MEDQIHQVSVETQVVSPAELKDYQALLQGGPLGVLLVIILLLMKFRKELFVDQKALEQSQKLLEQRLSKIEAKLDFMLECLEDDDTKK